MVLCIQLRLNYKTVQTEEGGRVGALEEDKKHAKEDIKETMTRVEMKVGGDRDKTGETGG